MKYYINNHIKDTWETFEDWWKLLEHFYTDGKYDINTTREMTRSIAHTENEKRFWYSEWNTTLAISFNPKYELRPEIVFNEDMQIVNISEIRKGLKSFKKKSEVNILWCRSYNYKGVYYDFRTDPVPGIKIHRGNYYRSCVKKNKSYVAKLQEYKDLFPSDASINKLRFHVMSWNDDFNTSKCGKSWKKQKKIKQWM